MLFYQNQNLKIQLIMSSQIEEVCKIGQGNDCCRYLVVGPNGFECAKHTALKRYLDTRVTNKLITA